MFFLLRKRLILFTVSFLFALFTSYYAKGVLIEKENGAFEYYDSKGEKVSNTWVCIKPEKVEKKGEYDASVYWYYFKDNGESVRAKDGGIKRTTIDGKKYIFNEYGQMLTGFINEEGEVLTFEDYENPFAEATYYCGNENDGVVKTGWVNYTYGYDVNDEDDYRYDLTNIYLYFDLRNGKKVTGSRKIDGKNYIFNDEGIMLSRWDAYEQRINERDDYYGERDDGARAKSKWVFAVPLEKIDKKAYDEEEKKYFYYDSTGTPVKNVIKKIDKKYYAFNKNGIMQKGLVIFHETEGYIATVDFDYALADEFMHMGALKVDEEKTFYIDWDGDASGMNTEDGFPTTGKVKLYYFGDEGDRIIGKTTLPFTDLGLNFESMATGHRKSGIYKNSIYGNGAMLKALDGHKYGVVTLDIDTAYGEQQTKFYYNLSHSKYKLIDDKGKVLKSKRQTYDDKNGQYFLVGGANKQNFLLGIWTEKIKYVSKKKYTINEVFDEASVAGKTSEELLALIKNRGILNTEVYDLENPQATYTAEKGSNGYKIVMNDYTGYMFYDESDEKKKPWKPCGMLDSSGKTICVKDYSKGDYQIEMSDEIFINCTWS